MGKRARYEPGTFCWVDLATTDPADAKSFYGEFFGWTAEDVPFGEGGIYTMLRLGGDVVAALYELEPDRREQGIPSHWFHYVSVAEVGETAARARALGGTVHGEPFAVGDSGRMAVIQDPTGAVFAAWQPGTHIGAGRVNDPGCLTWNELQTRDPEAAIAFYTGLLGWEAEPVEEGGRLAYVSLRHGGRLAGGMMPMGELHRDALPAWLAYFTVPSCDAGVARARDLGGGVLAGPMDVGNGRIAVVHDRQAASFALFEGQVDD